MIYEKADLQQAVNVLKAGGVILYPTDTVWGIGCDARNEKAVQRIFDIKHRADSKSMLVLLDAPGKLQGYVQDIPDNAWSLMEMAVRPLTLIYPGARNLAPNLIAEDGSVGIRVTADPFCQALCRGIGAPVVSTSANISGQPAAAVFSQISQEIIDAVDYVCMFRRDDETPAAPSSIIKVGPGSLIKIIRE